MHKIYVQCDETYHALASDPILPLGNGVKHPRLVLHCEINPYDFGPNQRYALDTPSARCHSRDSKTSPLSAISFSMPFATYSFELHKHLPLQC